MTRHILALASLFVEVDASLRAQRTLKLDHYFHEHLFQGDGVWQVLPFFYNERSISKTLCSKDISDEQRILALRVINDIEDDEKRILPLLAIDCIKSTICASLPCFASTTSKENKGKSRRTQTTTRLRTCTCASISSRLYAQLMPPRDPEPERN